MPVFDATQNQALFSPVSNYYKGKAIRQGLAAGEQDAELKGLQIESVKQELADAPARRAAAEEKVRLDREKAQLEIAEAHRKGDGAELKRRADVFGPVVADAMKMWQTGDEAGALEFANKELPLAAAALGEDVVAEMIQHKGEDGVWQPDELMRFQNRLEAHYDFVENEENTTRSARYKQAVDGGLKPGTPEFNKYVLNEGGDAKPSEKEKEIERYIAMGEDYDKAVDLAYDNLDVTSSTDEKGYVTVTNKRTEDSYKISARAARAAGLIIPDDTEQKAKEDSWDTPIAMVNAVSGVDKKVVQNAQLDMVELDQALMQAAVISGADIEEGVGSMSNLQRGLNSLSQFSTLNMAPRFAEEETLAADKLAKFVQLSKKSLMNSRVGATWEQKTINNILPNPNNWFSDPEGEGYKYTQIVQAMMQQREIAVALQNGRKPNFIQRIPMGTESDPIIIEPDQDVQELLVEENVGKWIFYNGAAVEIGAR